MYSNSQMRNATRVNFEADSVINKLYTIATLINKYKPAFNVNNIDDVLAEAGAQFLYDLADAVDEDGLIIELNRALADFNS